MPALHWQLNRRTTGFTPTPDRRRYRVGDPKIVVAGVACVVGLKKLTTTSRGCNHDESAQIQKSNLHRLAVADGLVCDD